MALQDSFSAKTYRAAKGLFLPVLPVGGQLVNASIQRPHRQRRLVDG